MKLSSFGPAAKFYCSFSYWLHYFCSAVSISIVGEASPLQSSIEKQRVLRGLLKKVPFWTWGHLQLALVEKYLYEHIDKSQALACKSAVKISAQAALKLSSESKDSSVIFKSKILLAVVAFYDNQFQEALAMADAISKQPNFDKVSAPWQSLLYEYAGYAAMGIEDEKEAKTLFLKIPEKVRNDEVRASLSQLA